jgi:phosphatidylglycerol:prolipoprotein diacylglycerol transferase
MRSTLFHLGPIPVHAYGFMLMLGFAAGLALALRQAPRYRFDPEKLIDLTLFALVASIVGARLVYVLLDLPRNAGDYVKDPWLLFKTWKGGLAFHGGLGGGILAMLFFCRRQEIPWRRLADALAPSVALGYAITRIGCFLNGCCHGRPTDLPWAVSFLDPLTHQRTPPSHPTQIYSLLALLAACGLLLWLRDRRPFEGFLAVGFLALYSMERFLVEFLRADLPTQTVSARVTFTGLTQAQIASLIILAFSVWLGYFFAKHPLPKPLVPSADWGAAPPSAAREGPRKKQSGRRKRRRQARAEKQ